MIHLPASVRVYLCLTACDMRKSFDGLHARLGQCMVTGIPCWAAQRTIW